ncbi:MAG: YeeE/YedE thiosulfate transporter family protein [Desulfovibrionaceae bacterium]|nr:YeeE/YedE family protein [Desulfovibrionaceae bacterium]MDD4951010.1 YeeE/YedE thiosulfate transporter family protein [Desulfovibrionaceae bacterium]
MDLVYGLVTGVLFGLLMQKSEVLRYDRQIGALRLKDMTIVKFMLTAVIVAMAGIYALYDLNLVKLSIKGASLGGQILGGLIFGAGWGLLGYCPGTSAGALGEGRWDAAWGILGMLLGAAVFAEMYTSLKNTVLAWGDLGKLTLPGVLGLGNWVAIAGIWVLALVLFWWFEQKRL